jgi:GNAT superfamily N-acetyltransferase
VTEITYRDMQRIAPLFEGVEETMLWSCLEGAMGRAWADDRESPRCARVITGDFCIFAGDASAPGAAELLRTLPPLPGAVLVPQGGAWAALIEQTLGPAVRKSERYATQKDPACFDRAHLRGIVSALPAGFLLRAVDEAGYRAALSAPWSRDLCSQFRGWADYEARGCGFLVWYGGRPVSGASSYTVYSGGIEIEVDTHPAFRRRGLAAAASAALILRCLEQGRYPSWDAANRASLALAEKLGYRFSHAYPAYLLGTAGGEQKN